jgi:hypothetical protein
LLLIHGCCGAPLSFSFSAQDLWKPLLDGANWRATRYAQPPGHGARWYDPTNGTFTAISDAPLANTGSATLATPGANAAGDYDWVLVLEAN